MLTLQGLPHVLASFCPTVPYAYCTPKHWPLWKNSHWWKLKANRLAQQKPTVSIPIRTPAGNTGSRGIAPHCTAPMEAIYFQDRALPTVRHRSKSELLVRTEETKEHTQHTAFEAVLTHPSAPAQRLCSLYAWEPLPFCKMSPAALRKAAESRGDPSALSRLEQS